MLGRRLCGHPSLLPLSAFFGGLLSATLVAVDQVVGRSARGRTPDTMRRRSAHNRSVASPTTAVTKPDKVHIRLAGGADVPLFQAPEAL